MRHWMLRSISGILAIGWLLPCAYAATAPVQRDLLDTRLTPFANTEVKPRQSGERGPQTGNPLWAIPLESLSSTRERPLFSSSRRPPAQAIAAPPPQPRAAPVVPEQLQLTLVGTVVGGNEDIGIFLDNATKNVVRLQVGQGVAGWTLRDIQARTATFNKDQRQTMLALPSRNGRQNPPQILTNQPTPTPPLPAARGSAPSKQTRPPEDSKRESSAPVASVHDDDGVATSSGTWRDGDGQLISPPKSLGPVVNTPDTPAAGGAATWTDGDGEMIAPPRSYRAANDGRPPAPKAANWRDGDGQAIQPPPEPTGYGGGRWVDGDGQFVSPPSR